MPIDTDGSTDSSVEFVLAPPEAVAPLDVPQANKANRLPPDTESAVDNQVGRFIEAVLTEDLNSDSFKGKLDSAFRLGREEISIAASLMTGRFMERNMIGMEDSPAFRAIEDMRKQLDDLDPGKEGDLLTSNKFLGVIPFGNRMKSYFRRFQSASTQLSSALKQIYAARDDMQRDGIEIESTRTKLWDAMQRLKAAIRFAEQLDASLAAKVAALKATDPERARALEQEVLYYARQNLQDMQTQQAVCVNGYLSLDVLKKTCREMGLGCERVATTGMSALAVAQTVARATGNQVRVMEMLEGVNSTIANLISESGKQLNDHAERTAKFSGNPLLGIEKIKEMFEMTFKAMDTMDNFRAKAIEAMAQNNAVMKDQVAKAQSYIDRVRREKLKDTVTPGLEGPVRL